MDAAIKGLQQLPPAANPDQKLELAELLSLERPLPPYFYVAHGLIALGTQEGVDALKSINLNFDEFSAKLVATKLEELGATSFVVMNQTYSVIKDSSNEAQISESVAINARLGVPVLLYMGGALHCITAETTFDKLYAEARAAAEILRQAKDYRIESLEEIRNNDRLQKYLGADFGMKPDLLEQLLALPEVEYVGIANCQAGADIKEFATKLKTRAAEEGVPICFAATYGGADYLLVIEPGSDINTIFKKLEDYSKEARKRSEEQLETALEEFFSDYTLAQPENMLKWLYKFKQADLFIGDESALIAFQRRAENLGYVVESDSFISQRLFNPEKINEITAYLMRKSDLEVDKLVIANCLHEISEGGSLIFSIGIPRKKDLQELLDRID